jgi:hypothetical protein
MTQINVHNNRRSRFCAKTRLKQRSASLQYVLGAKFSGLIDVIAKRSVRGIAFVSRGRPPPTGCG